MITISTDSAVIITPSVKAITRTFDINPNILTFNMNVVIYAISAMIITFHFCVYLVPVGVLRA